MTSNRGSATTPAEDAFYLPADFCRHARTWIAWPAQADGAVADAIAAIIKTLAAYEPVTVVAAPGFERDVERRCGGDNITVVALDHTSARLRDTGPTFLVDGKGGSAAVDWCFNNWGGQTDSKADPLLAHALLGQAEVRRFRAAMTFEGGAFICDGRGTVVAMAGAAFDPRRNASLSRLEAFSILQNWLGISRVIWLESALPGDSKSDARTLCAFLAPGVAAVPETVDGAHPYHAVLAETGARLRQTKDARGEPLEIVPLPVPRVDDVNAAPLSYTGFYPANQVLLVPAYGDKSDEAAVEILGRAFPDRVVRPIPALSLARAGIGLHSLLLPHPARLLERDRATVLPRSAWSKPAPDYDGLIQKYIDMADET